MEPTQSAALLGRDYPIRPVPFTAVQCDDVFWAPRIETNRAVTVTFTFDQCERTDRVALLRRAGAVLRGDARADRTLPGYPFDETDLYKVIEGAAYTLRVHPDPALEAYIDGLTQTIAAAQEPDGYLYPARTINPAQPHEWAGPRRWAREREHSHELYNFAHLTEAAVAYEQATGKRALRDIAGNEADLLARTFGPGRESIWPGHQGVELALVRLYRATGEPRYLDLARFLLDARGADGEPGKAYNQAHQPVVAQSEAVGHAVRAVYMYAGMADVAAITGDARYVAALDRIWADVVGSKLYVTGGIGARHEGEAFGRPYELPNLTAYCETCAAIGHVFWAHRLFLLHGDARYIDVLERTLYNALIDGVSLDGMAFFYDNPLESDGWQQRQPWFGCACCPGNVVRFLPSLPGYAYAMQDDTLYVNLFVAGSAEVPLAGGPVRLTQKTRYPWEGQVRLAFELATPRRVTLKLRVPGWARDEAVPSDLYRFVDTAKAAPTLAVNGEPVALEMDRGYATVTRTWRPGDEIALDLPMPVRRVAAQRRVEADRGRVALQRGPLVYCAEWPDNPGGAVRDLLLPDDAPLEAEFAPDLLGGVVVLRGQAVRPGREAAGRPARIAQDFTAIPYYAWANRGPGEMIVWLRNADALHPG